MPVYQYKGQFYELAETDPAAAKAKILSHLGEQAPAAPVSPPQTLAAQAGLDQRPSMPAGFMLRPEFVEQTRAEYGNLPPEQRRTALQEASMGRGIRADAAKRILADLAIEDQRRREMTQGREGLMGILAAAQQQPAPRQPAAPAAGPAPRVQFPDVSPTIGDIMDMVPEKERIQRRLAQDEAARTLEAAESSVEAIRAREQERMGGFEQVAKSFTEVGIPTAEAGALGLTAVAQQAQMAKIGDQLKALESQGKSDSPEANRLRKVLEHYSKRQQVYLGDLAQTQAKLSTAPVYRGVRELTEAETFTDAAKAFARDPISIVANLTAQSLPSMLPALVLGVINPALGVAAMGGSSYGVEFGNELLGFAREKGFDTTDPKQMAQFMQNSELLREGVNRAGTKAGIVAAGDMLLTGLASKTLVPKRITGPVAKNVTNVGVQMGVQGVGGAGTEALAQYVTTGEIKPGEVVAEAVGELGGAPAEVLTQTAQARREARAAQAAQPPAPPPAAPVPPAPAAPAGRIEPTFEERPVPPVPGERVEPTLEGAPAPSTAAQTMREQQDAVEKMEREALKLEPDEPIQEVAKEALQVEPTPPQTELPRQAVVEVPVGQLKLSEDVPQFKMGADKAGIVEPLGGKFERTGVAPIQVWRRTDGRMEIISGRHRFDLAKRSGEATIPAQIHDESKGFTRDMAAVLDAELNIRDGQGKVKDYVNYFKGTGLDRETANARGLLARAPGKRAFSIANDGSDELIAGVRADQIPDEAAYLVAINAPGDARLQSVGIKAIADGKSAATAVNMMQAVRALAGEADTTTDMFGFDDSAMKEAEEMAKIAGRKQKEIQTRLSAISGAARNPQLAASEGIDIRDPQAVNNRINELRQMKAAWDNWSVNPELIAEIRAERGVAPPVLTTQTPEELRAKTEREERARKEEQAKPAEVPPAEEFVLTGSERAADEAAARGQMELAPAEEKAEAKPGEAVDENDTGFRGASDEEVKEVAGAFKDAEQSQEDERETRVFDPPTKNEVVRIEDKVRVYTKDRGYMTLDEAKQEIAKWRQHAFEQGDTGVNADKIVLSLFDLTGEWSMPWDAAGYQVFRFDIQTDPEYGDVSKFSGDFFNDIFGAFEGRDIYAILAACPCTDFASSGARHFAAKDEDGRTLESVELVRQTLATIEYFKPSVWAIENPVGRIEKLTGLPPWRSSWNPNHFGDPYTKKTLLWGRFNADMPIAPVEATEGSKMHRMYGGKSQATKNARSVTPEGFAYAFFMANNAVDNPVLAISNKYDLMDRAVFEEAVNAGMTYEEISSVVDEPYYFSRDYKQAEADLRAAAKGASPEALEEELPDLPVPEGFVPKKGRVTGMVMAARELAAGRISKAKYDQYVEKYMPIRMVLGGNLESPIEDGLMKEILTQKIKGKKKDPKLVNAPVADGTRVGLRMDIPALEWGKENGVNGSVVSIHQGKDPDRARGENVSYKSTGYIKNVVMAPRDEERAFGIAQQLEGKQGEKSPQQTIEGEWVNISPEETFRLVKQNLDNPDWVQVSLDPLRHSYFYARDSKRPVLSADEVLQVGRFVLAKNPVYGEREQFLYSIDTDQPKGYDFSSQEPIAGEQSNRSPSLKRKVKTLNRQREDGKITPEKFVEEVDAAVKADEESKYDKAAAARVRGADYIRQRLLEAKRRGELSEESVNLAEWFILQNENLVGDLGIAIKTPKKGGTAGMYATLQRIMVLMKGAANDSTIVHEILHHLERMMPAEVQQAIRKAWLRSLVAAQKKAKTPEEKFFFEALMNHHFGTGSVRYLKDAPKFILMLSGMGVDTNLYDRSYRVAIEMLRLGLVKMDNYQFVNPSEFWAVNGSEIVRGRYEAVQGGVLARLKNWLKELGERIKGMFGMRSDAPLIKALDSLSKADGKFVSRDMLSSQEDYLQIGKNIYGRKPLAAWTMPDETKLDADLIYRLQNKQIDLKRAVDAIEEAAGGIEDRWDAYLQEELYHGRTARETANFLREEVRPLLEAMNEEDVSIADFEEYLHNRFAEERNIQIAKVNPAYPNDGTPFSGGSGIDTADAQAYLNSLTPEQRTKYERLAKMVDGITKGTREYLVDSGLEDRSTIDSWESAAPNYVPLNRGDVEYSTTVGTGTGLGYSVRGPSSRRATGSRRTVVDILPNIIMQRERAIVRGEKNRVAVAVYGLAVQNPNSEVWLAVNPQAKTSKKKAVDELINMGLTQQDAEGLMEEPAATVVDPQTGLVTKRVNPVLRGAGNVLAARVNGQDRYVFFNTQNPRAARMVSSLKNMDADQLGTAMSLVASLTRWFASINTQYNPIFGPYNFLRDFQGAAIQLSGTELADSRAKVLSPANIAGAMSGIYSTLRKERAGVQPATKQWADLWQDFQAQGGQTGYRDMFSRSQERAEALQREIDRMNQGVVRRGGNAIFGWLADYNETLENAVRLSAYKAGLDAGMSKERAASLAKNLTVNFNRKGQVGVQVGALYAFFNSAVQGTTRLLQTVAKMERPGDITSLRLTKAGKAVIYGGLLIGTAQAIALSAMGYDENEPPDFVKDRNLIIPLGDGKYLAWPLPLGYHVIPAIGRILTEWMIAGGKDPAKRIVHLADVILDAFNPIGNAGLSAQSIAPTVADPIVALTENRDWTGKKIAREDVSKLDPTPGYTRARENASWISRQLSYYLNLASGGDKDKPGVFSPTPDQIDYLVGQVTGGLGREILKAAKTTEATVTGEELAPYNIPLAGRFYGDTKAGYAESARFYKNLEELNILENQLKGRQSRKESVTEFVKENPKLRLVESARETERNIRELRKQRKDLVEKGASREAVKAKENLITNQMKRLNDQVKKLEETPKKPAN